MVPCVEFRISKRYRARDSPAQLSSIESPIRARSSVEKRFLIIKPPPQETPSFSWGNGRSGIVGASSGGARGATRFSPSRCSRWTGSVLSRSGSRSALYSSIARRPRLVATSLRFYKNATRVLLLVFRATRRATSLSLPKLLFLMVLRSHRGLGRCGWGAISFVVVVVVEVGDLPELDARSLAYSFYFTVNLGFGRFLAASGSVL